MSGAVVTGSLFHDMRDPVACGSTPDGVVEADTMPLVVVCQETRLPSQFVRLYRAGGSLDMSELDVYVKDAGNLK